MTGLSFSMTASISAANAESNATRRAKQTKTGEQRFPIISHRFPFKHCVQRRGLIVAFRPVDYHFTENDKFIFQDSTKRRCSDGSADNSPESADYFSAALCRLKA